MHPGTMYANNMAALVRCFKFEHRNPRDRLGLLATLALLLVEKSLVSFTRDIFLVSTISRSS